jgi:hypothetical protein
MNTMNKSAPFIGLSEQHDAKAGGEKEPGRRDKAADRGLITAFSGQGEGASLEGYDCDRELPDDGRGVPKLCGNHLIDFEKAFDVSVVIQVVSPNENCAELFTI